MLKLATILDNPGEPFAGSRYRDPKALCKLGYNGIVLYETTGLSGVESPESVGTGEMRRWIAQQFEIVQQRIESGVKAGLDVYISYDVLSLARHALDKDASEMTCARRPSTLCPASEEALERSGLALEALLRRFPSVKGVVLRIGDNDAARLPYLIGNDIYSPHCARCSVLGRADRITLVLNHFHNLVVAKHGKRLIARTWNVRPNGLHDSVELCKRVVERLPGDPEDDRFILSFKFTQTDFWRYQNWNPSSLAAGRRPIIYELQCQREFEGKGSIPNWQVPLWRDGYPESKSQSPSGLAQVASSVNLAGLWAWVRGGGWGGPFINNETWIDANVFAVPKLADNPKADPIELAKSWVTERLNIRDPDIAKVIVDILKHSPAVIRDGFYIGPYATTKADPWHPSADWIQDDLVDAQAAWRIIQRLPDNLLDQVAAEKQEAVTVTAQDYGQLQHLMTDQTRSTLEPLLHTLQYEESFYQALRDLLGGLIAYRRFLKSKDANLAETCKQKLTSAQSHWSSHTQRFASTPGAATAFRENHFWELTQQILAELG